MTTIKAVFLAFLFNVMVVTTTALNVCLGGDGGETLSSRLGKGKLAGKPVHTFASRIVDLFFEILFNQRDHCIHAIQHDEGRNAVSEVVDRARRGEDLFKRL